MGSGIVHLKRKLRKKVTKDVCVRTVTVSDTNAVGAIKELLNKLPLVHENMIKNSVSDLKLLAVEKYAIKKVNHYEEMSVFHARQRKYNKTLRDEDCDSDDPMYDEPYQAIGPLFDSNFLNINKTDLLHFIHVLVYESREWDNHYYNDCGKTVTSCVCPCSKLMRQWRTEHNLMSYSG